MCNPLCIQFGRSQISREEVENKSVLEVGAFDVNGSLRGYLEGLNPGKYMGVDLVEGPGVDEICNIYDLVTRFGKDSFDLVICTEVFEHVRDWRSATTNLKNVLKPNGILLLTTRSKGFRYHGYPYDFWRYEIEDMKVIFSDLTIEALEPDLSMPGVFIKGRKPDTFSETDLSTLTLFSIVTRNRRRNITNFNISLFKVKKKIRKNISKILPGGLKTYLKRNFA